MASAASARPSPPAPHPPTVRAEAAGRWWRIHPFNTASDKYRADRFNDSGQGDARFSPLHDDAGNVIPTLYAAKSRRTAIAEILLHDLPTPSTGHLVDWDALSDPARHLHLSEIDLPALQLAALTTFGLKAAGLEVDDLIGGDAPEYPRTRQWARWLHDHMPAVHGLFWMSRRDNEHACVVLFEHRLAGLPPIEPGGTQPVALFRTDVQEVVDLMGASMS